MVNARTTKCAQCQKWESWMMMEEMRSATMVKSENMNHMVEMGKMSNGINEKHKLQWKWESVINSRNGKCKNQNWKMVVAMDLKHVMYILGSLQS